MAELLKLENIVAGYGEARVLDHVSLILEEGKALALLGRNGTGKTTLVNTIAGVTRRFEGTIALAGRDITRMRPDQRALAGIGWVPQERNIFKSLTVRRTSPRCSGRDPGTSSASGGCFRASRSGGATGATSSPAASSRCWRSRVHWCSIPS